MEEKYLNAFDLASKPEGSGTLTKGFTCQHYVLRYMSFHFFNHKNVHYKNMHIVNVDTLQSLTNNLCYTYVNICGILISLFLLFCFIFLN